ncbi:MAG TPA: hypothetical protein VIV14_08890, partial [Gammaproteobacteria bacterium]
RWLAYASDESGRSEIYVRSYPDVDTGGRWQISTGGGTRPLWSRDGAELFYVSGGATTGDNALMSVPVEATDQTFIPGRPEVILEGDYASFEQGGRSYDVSPDGERFLMMKDAASAAGRSRIVVVENWFEEVQRLVPTE